MVNCCETFIWVVPWSNPKPTGPQTNRAPNQQLTITTSSKLRWLGGKSPFSIGKTYILKLWILYCHASLLEDDVLQGFPFCKDFRIPIFPWYFPIRTFNGSFFSYKTQTDSAFLGPVDGRKTLGPTWGISRQRTTRRGDKKYLSLIFVSWCLFLRLLLGIDKKYKHHQSWWPPVNCAVAVTSHQLFFP